MKLEKPHRSLSLHKDTLVHLAPGELEAVLPAAGPIAPPRSVGGSAGHQCCQI